MKRFYHVFIRSFNRFPRGFMEQIAREHSEECARADDGKAVVSCVFGYWVHSDLLRLLSCYGTARPGAPVSDAVKCPYLPGFEKYFAKTTG